GRITLLMKGCGGKPLWRQATVPSLMRSAAILAGAREVSSPSTTSPSPAPSGLGAGVAYRQRTCPLAASSTTSCPVCPAALLPVLAYMLTRPTLPATVTVQYGSVCPAGPSSDTRQTGAPSATRAAEIVSSGRHWYMVSSTKIGSGGPADRTVLPSTVPSL